MANWATERAERGSCARPVWTRISSAAILPAFRSLSRSVQRREGGVVTFGRFAALVLAVSVLVYLVVLARFAS